jgi:hypothetical protein
MSTVNLNLKNKMKGIVKYLIFNMFFFAAFFVLNAQNVDAAIDGSSNVVIHQSNHSGNNGDNNDAFKAVGKCSDGTDNNCHSDWYIQGTGVSEKDVVTFTLTVTYDASVNFDGLVIFEDGYTSAGGKSYDAYKKSYDDANGYVWGASPGGS